MNPDQIFAIANPLAALSWLLLIVAPKRAALITGLAVPAILAVLYSALDRGQLGRQRRRLLQPGGRRAAVRQPLAAARRLAALPLSTCWSARGSTRRPSRGVPHLLVVPCLTLTFLFGPAGWLLYKAVSLNYRGQRPADS